jgi:hypothetical protein
VLEPYLGSKGAERALRAGLSRNTR